MKISSSNDQNQALTLIEVVVVLFSFCLLAALLLATLSAPRVRNDVSCVNQLKQMGLAARFWSADHNVKFLATLLATNGYAEAIFQMSSNELGNTRILVCPADKRRRPARNFGVPLAATNLSYFVNPDLGRADPQAFVLGDDNFEIRGVHVKSGLLEVTSNSPIAWTADRHTFRGNVALADGSVQGMSNLGLRNFLRTTNAPGMRLAIP